MARFVSRRNPVSVNTLKRKTVGSVVIYHGGREDVHFTRIKGGWIRVRTDITSETPSVVPSSAVANECNTAMGCKESWARVYQSQDPQFKPSFMLGFFIFLFFLFFSLQLGTYRPYVPKVSE